MNVFNLFAKLSLDKKDYEKGVDSAKKKNKELSDSTDKTKLKTTAMWAAIGAAVLAVGNKIRKLTLDTLAYGDKFYNMSQRYDIATEKLQEFQYIASQTGISLDTVLRTMRSLERRVGAGNKNFAKLGVSIRDTNGNAREMSDIFNDTVAALQRLDEAERAPMATQILGEQGARLNQFLNLSNKEMENMREQAHELGIIMDEDVVTAGNEFNNNLEEFRLRWKTISAELISGVDGAEEKLDEFMEDLTDWIGKITPMFLKAASNLLGKLLKMLINHIPELVKITGVALMRIQEMMRSIDWWSIIKDTMFAIRDFMKFALVNTVKQALNLIPGFNYKIPKAEDQYGDFADWGATEQVHREAKESKSSVDVNVKSSGESEIEQDNADKIAEALLPHLNAKLGGEV